MAIQSADKYDAVVAAIDEHGAASRYYERNGGSWSDANAKQATNRWVASRAALCAAIDAWATARDAAIRAEERAKWDELACTAEILLINHDNGYPLNGPKWNGMDELREQLHRARASSSATQPEPARDSSLSTDYIDDHDDGALA